MRKGVGIFSQGDACDTLCYVQQGNVKLTVTSEHEKRATIALLSPGDFAGEECIASLQGFRSATAIALTDCVVLKISKDAMTSALREEHALSTMFVAYLLARMIRIQAD